MKVFNFEGGRYYGVGDVASLEAELDRLRALKAQLVEALKMREKTITYLCSLVGCISYEEDIRLKEGTKKSEAALAAAEKEGE
jgi:hypothetical protein